MGRSKEKQAGGTAVKTKVDRKKEQRTGLHYNCYVQVLGTGMDTGDTGPSILLFFDNKRILFNVGEGFQRYCIEHKVRLSKLNHLFFSRVSSETFGGLPGLLLTLHGVTGAPLGMGLYGPPPLDQLVDAMGSFCPVRALGCQTYCFRRDGSLGKATTSSGGYGPVDFRRDPLGAEGANLGLSSPPQEEPPIQGSTGEAKVVYQDEFVTISAVVLAPGGDASYEAGGSESSAKRARLEGGGQQPPPLEALPPPGKSDSQLSVVYICELPEVPGKFDPEKAKALGLKPGREYAQLVKGESITAPNGTVIRPSDVMEPTTPGPVFVLVDCPTAEHLGALLGAQGLARFRTGSNGQKQVNVVIHLSPPSVVALPAYQEWVASLGHVTKHVVAGYGHHGLGRPVYLASMRLTAKLNCIAPEVFPLHMPAEQQAAAQEAGEAPDKIAALVTGQGSSVDLVPGQNLLKYTLRPLAQQGFDDSLVSTAPDISELQREVVTSTPEALLAARDVAGIAGPNAKLLSEAERLLEERKADGAMQVDDSTDAWRVRELSVAEEGGSEKHLQTSDAGVAISEADLALPRASNAAIATEVGSLEKNGQQSLPECLQGVGREEMELVFLGTGSSQPSKYRNVSAIYGHRFARGGFLMDCGEGTYGQLKRRYGAKMGDQVLAHLHLVWISHIHADHHAGLVRIIAARKGARKTLNLPPQPLVIIAPRLLRRFLSAYDRVEGMDLLFVDCAQTLNGSQSRTGLQPFSGLGFERSTDSAAVQGALSKLGLASLVSVPVIHCPQAYGLVIDAEGKEGKRGLRLAYSGDTRPCNAFVEASQGATVFIHEATFDNDLEDEAVAKRHSTTREAVTAGASAGAFRTILTHFSQRYPKMPVVDESFTDRTCVAFDMMSLNVADLAVVPKLMAVLKVLFPEDGGVEAEIEGVEEAVET